ncbi:hypothetical protein ALC56_02139 [Trachymyrmex septentrionalis]|uniref:Uncharacterized protein n=1 Tax=Trachymyrmex septentrionalis TaxID=34720 RepID=A0A195FSH3_9HYME|nr:hypothetical protein ALC56_02139 [Trachymyrmex septentrionalis]
MEIDSPGSNYIWLFVKLSLPSNHILGLPTSPSSAFRDAIVAPVVRQGTIPLLSHDRFSASRRLDDLPIGTRAVSRDTRERPCIYFAYIRHGFEHGHTEHNLGESINDRRCEREEKE